MPRQNPYMMDPLLAQGFSNLTKALIGDPETDYQVSRTGYQDAQTNRLNKLVPFEIESEKGLANQRNSTAGNQAAQGKYYNAQTAEQLALTDAANTLSSDVAFQGAAAAVLGLPEGSKLTPEALQALALTAIGGGNPSQRANALEAIGAGGQNRAAGDFILNGTDDQAQRGALFKAPSGGQYQNPAFAAEALQANNQTDIEQTGITAQATVDAAAINANATKAYQNYRSDLQYGVGGSADREGQRKTTQAKWEHNNATLEINVEPGKQVVLSPAAGERLGLEPNDEGLYVLDGGPKPGSIVVKVGEEDVYLTEADATALGIEKNDAGTYMIPGRPKPGGGSSASPTSRTTQATQNLTEEMYADLTGFLKERIPASLGDLPNNVQVGTENYIINQVDNFIGKNPNTPYMDAYNKVGAPIVSGGLVELGNNNLLRSNIKVPSFFDEKWKSAAAKVGKPVTNGGDPYTRDQLVEAITKNATSLGYTPSDISKILESY